MKALFVIGILLMFVGIFIAAARPAPSSQQYQEPDKTTSKVITYSVFGGFILVIISWVSSLKNQVA